MGLIRPGEFPNPKTKGMFIYPQDFGDEPDIIDLRDGTYLLIDCEEDRTLR